MTRVVSYVGQGLIYAAIALLLGYLSQAPVYEVFPADKAQIKVSFSHGAERRGECRRRSAEELAEMAPNMRRPLDCPRERLPIEVEIDMDGQPLYRASLTPTGLSKDGPSRAYARFRVEPGSHRIVARLRDSARAEGFDYEKEVDVDLAPRQNLSISFRPDVGGFQIN